MKTNFLGAPTMRTFIVGGAVRDMIMGKEPKDYDYVVVGATTEEMRRQGFEQVGNDFPVFLDPNTKEEYALARTERKTGAGHQGFEFDTSPFVTLDQDLRRRDLTINAIAMDPNDNDVIDPLDGISDIRTKMFRHIDDKAFQEDPLRVLRVARLMARHEHEEWRVAEETSELMAAIVKDGKLDELTPERVWKELSRALEEPTPSAFIDTLRECGALEKILPEVNALFGVPQPEKHHPEIDSGVHTMMAMDQAAKISDKIDVRFAAMVHDLGKGTTPESEWPKHIGHEQRGVPLVQALCDRLKVPNTIRKTALLTTEYHLRAHLAQNMKPTIVTRLLEAIHDKNRPEQIEDILKACEADAKGRGPLWLESTPYPQRRYLMAMNEAANKIDQKSIAEKNKGDGERIKDEIYKEKVRAVKAASHRYFDRMNRSTQADPGRDI